LAAPIMKAVRLLTLVHAPSVNRVVAAGLSLIPM